MRQWRFGLNYGYFWSDLTFGGGGARDDAPDLDASIGRRGLTVTAEYRPTPRMTVALSGGAVFEGHVDIERTRHRLGLGWLAAGSFAFTALHDEGALPFALMTVSLGGSSAPTEQELPVVEGDSKTFTAIDGRVGVVVGKTFWNTLGPYATVRAFGGPIVWSFRGRDLRGTDKHHYQVAGGLLAALPAGFDLYAELAFLGERSVTFGGGYAF